jgi:ATP-dependent Clp protease ATP-binding subunit ClpC
VFERFTDRARRVVVFAQEEARLLNHNYIGTEHLLLGILREEEGVAARALASLEISVEAARGEVEKIVGEGKAPTAGHIPFTPRAKKVLELALREALQLGHNYIGTEHILLGLIREGEGVAAQVLQELGAALDQVRGSVMELLEGYTGTGVARETSEEPRQRWASRVRPRSRRGGGDGPRCPTCQAALEGSTGVKRVTATGDDEDQEIAVVYCRNCGRALGTAP